MANDANILPDSRCLTPTGVVRGPGGSWVPIFCANCGKDGGLVPEQNTSFAFWLCAKCGETCGEIAGMMCLPDEIFWEQVKQEQLAAHGRLLTEQELITIVEADTSPLATLLKQGR